MRRSGISQSRPGRDGWHGQASDGSAPVLCGQNDSQKYNNCSVIWIPALSMESFEQACRAIVDSWTIKNGLVDPKEAFKAFFTSPEAGNWFLVIDNADDISVLNGSGDQSSGVAHFIPDSATARVLDPKSVG